MEKKKKINRKYTKGENKRNKEVGKEKKQKE